MLLAIDTGNTNITLGVYDNETLIYKSRLATKKSFTEDEYGIMFYNMLDKEGLVNKVTSAIIASVVTDLTTTIKNATEKYLRISAILVSNQSYMADTRLLVDNPDEVGTDRICNVVAAVNMYSPPLIVVDMGTATTFEVINKDGDFTGGVICPGISLSLNALAKNTSLLPRVEVDQILEVVGKNTVTNILSGVIIGHAAMIDGIISRIESSLGYKTITIGTGGYCSYVDEHLQRPFDFINPQLTLEGLKILYEFNK